MITTMNFFLRRITLTKKNMFIGSHTATPPVYDTRAFCEG